MKVQINQSISVDCVVFGFGDNTLKVMLFDHHVIIKEKQQLKLPGTMIQNDESVPEAAARVMDSMMGLKNVYLKEVGIFSNPDRLSKEEIDWVNNYYGISAQRVVTVGYYALVKLNSHIIKKTTALGAVWKDIDEISNLAMDHKLVLSDALNSLYREFIHSHIAFELLPKKFTLYQLQNLYSTILGVSLDKRNFRKKILSSGYIVATEEKEKGVAHKPALFYTFNKSAYNKLTGKNTKHCLVNSWI